MADLETFYWPPEGGSGGVSTLNGLNGALTLVAGTGITITPLGTNITIAADAGGLVPNSGQVFTADLSSSAGYTFDPNLIEFVGGEIRQKSLVPATLINGQNVSISGNSVTKNAGISGLFDAGAISSQQITSSPGYVEFQIAIPVDSAVTGLTNSHPNYDYTSIQYGIATYDSGAGLVIFENGVAVTGTLGSWLSTDIFRVAVEAGVVVYRKNGVLLYTSLTPPTYPLFFVTSMRGVGDSVNNVNVGSYFGSVVTFPVFNYTGVGTLQAFTSSAITDANSPHYTLNALYWNGAAWVASNESYAQSNPAATIAANISTLPAANALTVRMVTNDGSAQMSLSALSITYTGQMFSAGGGTVTSVGLSAPSIFTVSGSPVTSAGTLALSLVSQSANTFFAAPNGSSGVPTFRAILAADLPLISLTTGVSGILPISNGGSGSATQNFVDLTTIQTIGGDKTFTGNISAANLSGTNTGDVTLGTANGLSLVGQVLSLGLSSATTTGALSSVDWDTFNNKGSGSVTSVALTEGVVFSVAGSPITTSGTLALSLISQSQNLFFASPDGAAGAPTFRAIVSADLPTLNQNTTGTASNVTGVVAIANGGTGQTTQTAAFNALDPLTTKGDLIVHNGTDSVREPVGANTFVLTADSTTGTGIKWAAPAAPSFTAPTVQTFASGSGTYITPANVLYIKVTMVGGGSGGAGSGTASAGNSSAGGNSTFGTTLLVANGGGISTGSSAAGGAGGTASLGTGPIGLAISGAAGSGAIFSGAAAGYFPGGDGGQTPLGGHGVGNRVAAGTGAVANSGSGGGGGGTDGSVSHFAGSGGGASGYVSAIIVAPNATYSYAVGASGGGGSAGTAGYAGGAGAAGYIEVTEYYS